MFKSSNKVDFVIDDASNEKKKNQSGSNYGPFELTIVGLILTVAFGNLYYYFAPPPSPTFVSSGDTWIQLAFETPIYGCECKDSFQCDNNMECAYEISLAKSSGDRQVESLVWTESIMKGFYSSSWLKATANITELNERHSGYYFRVRHSVHSHRKSVDILKTMKILWTDYSYKSELMFTTLYVPLIEHKSEHASRRRNDNNDIKKSYLFEPSGSGFKSPNQFLNWVQNLFTIFIHGLLLFGFVLFLLSLFNWDYVLVSFDIFFSIQKLHLLLGNFLMCSCLLELETMFGFKFHILVSNFLTRVLLGILSVVACIVGILILNLLWWHSKRLSWPLLSWGPSFCIVISFLSCTELYLLKPRVKYWIDSLSISPTGFPPYDLVLLYFLWVNMIFLFIMIVWMIENFVIFGSSNNSGKLRSIFYRSKTAKAL